MARTTIEAVEDAIETSLGAGVVSGFVQDASLWVDENLVGEGLSTALLTAIEKYLACHFVTLRDPRLRSAQLSDVQETYQRDTQLTEYLKAAAALDPTGKVEASFVHADKGSRFVFKAGDRYVDDAGGTAA